MDEEPELETAQATADERILEVVPAWLMVKYEARARMMIAGVEARSAQAVEALADRAEEESLKYIADGDVEEGLHARALAAVLRRMATRARMN